MGHRTWNRFVIERLNCYKSLSVFLSVLLTIWIDWLSTRALSEPPRQFWTWINNSLHRHTVLRTHAIPNQCTNWIENKNKLKIGSKKPQIRKLELELKLKFRVCGVYSRKCWAVEYTENQWTKHINIHLMCFILWIDTQTTID